MRICHFKATLSVNWKLNTFVAKGGISLSTGIDIKVIPSAKIDA